MKLIFFLNKLINTKENNRSSDLNSSSRLKNILLMLDIENLSMEHRKHGKLSDVILIYSVQQASRKLSK